jgi:hypothetical protein
MTSLSPNDLMGRAAAFGNELPDLHNIQRKRNRIVFAYIADGKMPVVKWKYQSENIDKLAISAWKKIFSGQKRFELLQKNFEIVFKVYFWYHDRIVGDMEFCYSMNDQFFKLQVA